MKKKSLFIVIAGFSFLAAATAYSSPSSEIGFWRLNETSGSTVFDFSGNNNDGAIGGSPTQAVSGITQPQGDWGDGLAYNFPGESSSDAVNLGDSSSFSLIESGDKSSLAAWVKVPDETGVHKVLYKQKEYGLKIEDSTAGNGDVTPRFDFFGENTLDTVGDVVPVGEWTHIAVVNDAGSWTAIYVNGTKVGNDTSVVTSSDTSVPLCISGSSVDGDSTCNDNNMGGRIDEPRIFESKLLSETEVENLYLTNSIDNSTVDKNNPPSLSNPSPANNSQDVNDSTKLAIDYTDPDGDSGNITVSWKNGSTIYTEKNVASGTTVSTNQLDLAENKTYSWQVKAESVDGITSAGNYTFTTGVFLDNYDIELRDRADFLDSTYKGTRLRLNGGVTLDDIVEFRDDFDWSSPSDSDFSWSVRVEGDASYSVSDSQLHMDLTTNSNDKLVFEMDNGFYINQNSHADWRIKTYTNTSEIPISPAYEWFFTRPNFYDGDGFALFDAGGYGTTVESSDESCGSGYYARRDQILTNDGSQNCWDEFSSAPVDYSKGKNLSVELLGSQGLVNGYVERRFEGNVNSSDGQYVPSSENYTVVFQFDGNGNEAESASMEYISLQKVGVYQSSGSFSHVFHPSSSKVNWTAGEVILSETGSSKVNVSWGENSSGSYTFYDSISSVPDSEYLKLKADYSTSDTSSTAEITALGVNHTSSVDSTTPSSSDNWTETGFVNQDSATVELTATDSGGSGVEDIYYRVNGGSYSVVQGSSATVSISSQGNNTLEYYAEDSAGNTEATNTEYVAFESNSAPTASFTTTTTDLQLGVDASGSSDSDGTTSELAWDWTNDGNYETVKDESQKQGQFYNVEVVSTSNGNKYLLNGTQQKNIDLEKGVNHTFNLTSSVQGHPFHITTSSVGGNFNGIVTEGVSVTDPYNGNEHAAETGKLYYKPPVDESQDLYYQCGIHSYMGADITFSSHTLSDPTVTHTYGSEGTYNVKLRVTDNDGAIDTQVKTISVSSSTNDGGDGGGGGGGGGTTDTAPPDTTDNWDVSGFLDKTQAAVSLSATDAGVGVDRIEYQINGNGFTSVSGNSASIDIFTEGNNTLEYYAVDNNGNEEQTNTEYVAFKTSTDGGGGGDGGDGSQGTVSLQLDSPQGDIDKDGATEISQTFDTTIEVNNSGTLELQISTEDQTGFTTVDGKAIGINSDQSQQFSETFKVDYSNISDTKQVSEEISYRLEWQGDNGYSLASSVQKFRYINNIGGTGNNETGLLSGVPSGLGVYLLLVLLLGVLALPLLIKVRLND